MRKFTLTAIAFLATCSLFASDWELYLADKTIIAKDQIISWDTPAGSKTHYFDVGVRILNGNPLKDGTETKRYSIMFKDKDWVPKHCSVVAYLYDESTSEIIQVEKLKVN